MTAGPVDFRSLDVRDFGTIYEGLLESGLSLATEDLAIDASGAWRPARAGEQRRRGHGRAVLPHEVRRPQGNRLVLHEAVRGRAPARARARSGARRAPREGRRARRAGRPGRRGRLFFDFRVADLAMGQRPLPRRRRSAISRPSSARSSSATRSRASSGSCSSFARPRSPPCGRVGVEEPEIDRSALLGRQIARRCVYGLDINDIAVELARLAIWVRTFVPGLPMSSLDHQLVCGNSLDRHRHDRRGDRGARPDARTGAMTFSGAAIRAALGPGARRARGRSRPQGVDERGGASCAGGRRAEALEAAEPARLLFDAAVAVRLG